MAKKVVKNALDDKKQLELILQNVKVKAENVRYANAEAFRILSEEYPKLLYPFFYSLIVCILWEIAINWLYRARFFSGSVSTINF